MPTPRRRPPAAALAAALAAAGLPGLPAPLGAQVVRGVVADSAGGGVAGAVVRLHRAAGAGSDAAGAALPAVLTDADGRFALRAPGPGAWVVEAKRIGVRPTRTGPLALAEGGATDVRLVVAPVVVHLSTVRVLGDPLCAGRVETARETAALWEEVRAALTATQLTASSRPPLRLTRWRRRLDPRTRLVLDEAQLGTASGALRFSAVPAPILSRRGYVFEERGGMLYHAPDAEGLLSPAFARDHCFRPVVSDSARGLVGLAFEPAAGRRLPDIAGVLWLDAATHELRRLEYAYTRLPHGVTDVGAGGFLEFSRLGDGGWIVSRWVIRMAEIVLAPAPPSGVPGADRAPRPRVAALLEEGGEAIPDLPPTRVADAAAAAPPAGAEPTIAGTVWDSSAGAPLAGARVTVDGTPYASRTDEGGRFLLRLHRPGAYRVSARHPRVDSLGLPRPAADVTVPAGAARLDLGVPSFATAAARLCPGGVPPGTAVLHGRVAFVHADAPAGAGWEVSHRWTARGAAAARPALEGRAVVVVQGTTRRYVICGVPADRAMRGTFEGPSQTRGALELRLAPGEVAMRDLVLQGQRP